MVKRQLVMNVKCPDSLKKKEQFISVFRMSISILLTITSMGLVSIWSKLYFECIDYWIAQVRVRRARKLLLSPKTKKREHATSNSTFFFKLSSFFPFLFPYVVRLNYMTALAYLGDCLSLIILSIFIICYRSSLSNNKRKITRLYKDI